MTSMVEKIARAMAYSIHAKDILGEDLPERQARLVERHYPKYVESARAALQALREPSEEMIAAAIYLESDPTAEAHRQIHRAMIDAALAEP